ncbi:MAG: hypothetical protein WB586_26940, partial [Chthoniobacterales bacterium]
LKDRLDAVQRSFGFSARRLGELAKSVRLGRFGADMPFQKEENAIFIPLIGTGDVVTSLEASPLKPHHYAQVVIDPASSDAQFVARFLNSELGRSLRESAETEGAAPRLHARFLEELPIFVPDLVNQQKMLEIETKIGIEENALLGLQNELASLRRELWKSPRETDHIAERLRTFAAQISSKTRTHLADELDDWFETLPFPLASILRAWQATSGDDFKTKYEHLLHFFEATAEFVSVVFLSAFSSKPAFFDEPKEMMARALQKVGLTFERPSFGTWKVVVECLGSQTRRLLRPGKNERALCGDLFADASLVLPETLSRAEIARVLSATNKLRNDWVGHGGVVGQAEARLRNEQLIRNSKSSGMPWAIYGLRPNCSKGSTRDFAEEFLRTRLPS